MSRVALALLTVILVASPRAGAIEAEVQTIAPFVDRDVVAVVRFDLAKLRISEMLMHLIPDRDEATEFSNELVPWFSALRQAGAQELFLVLDPSDLPGPPIAVVPLAENVDAKPIGKLLCGEEKEKPPLVWPTCATIHQAVFAGTTDALERVRRIKPIVRSELTAAFSAVDGRAAQVLLVPTNDNRRVFEEMLPSLPAEWGGGPITIFTRGFTWAAIGLETMPNPNLRMVVQTRDSDSVKAFEHVGHAALQWFAGLPRTQKRFPEFGKAIGAIKPVVQKDRLVLDVGLDQSSNLVNIARQAWRESFGRRQSVHNLLAIGLAMHNYVALYKSFPPAYTVDKEGKPLLSWRVLILPFLDQDSLFREFHLDEPWDSPHNRALAAKMPAVYRCPSISQKSEFREKTTYLVPRGKATVFPGAKGVGLKEITDGTSSTILTVDAGDDLATVWTKPQDWEVDPEVDMKGLFGHHPEGTNVGMADGSVHFLKETIKLELLKKMLTRNGGEVIGSLEQ